MNDRHDNRRRWLLFIYRVPQEMPGHRTYAWRQLKGLGATYLQQAAALPPDRPELRKALVTLPGSSPGRTRPMKSFSP